MRDQEFRARDKLVQKMTRDGLTEKNLTKGTEERVSSREKDFSYKRTEEAGGQTAPGTGRSDNRRYPPQERQRKQNGEDQPQTSEQSAHGRQSSGQNHGNPAGGSGSRRQENRENGGDWKQENPETGRQAGRNRRCCPSD